MKPWPEHYEMADEYIQLTLDHLYGPAVRLWQRMPGPAQEIAFKLWAEEYADNGDVDGKKQN